MNPSFENKRIALFVDLISQYQKVQYIFDGGKINYKAYLNSLKKEGIIHRAIAYGSCVSNEANDFIKCLKMSGFETKYVYPRCYQNRPVIKYTNRSVDIVLDVIRMIDKLDIVIIGSCNYDLAPFFTFLKEKGIRVIVYSCGIPRVLKETCDEWWEIDEDVLEPRREDIMPHKLIEANNEIINTA